MQVPAPCVVALERNGITPHRSHDSRDARLPAIVCSSHLHLTSHIAHRDRHRYFAFCDNRSCDKIGQARADAAQWGATTLSRGWSIQRLRGLVAAQLHVKEMELWQACELSVVHSSEAEHREPWFACPSAEIVLIWMSKMALLLTAMAAFPAVQRFAWVDAGFNQYRDQRPRFGAAVTPAPWRSFWPTRDALAVRLHTDACNCHVNDACARYNARTASFFELKCIYGAFFYGSRRAMERFSVVFFGITRGHVQTRQEWGPRQQAFLCSDQDL